MSLWILALLACTSGEGGPGAVGDDTGDGGTDAFGPSPLGNRGAQASSLERLQGGPACPDARSDTLLEVPELDASRSEWMPTVLHVVWGELPGGIHYDDGVQVRFSAGVAGDDGGHQAWLVGPRERSGVRWWFEAADGSGCTEARVDEVGELPVPALEGLAESPGAEPPVAGLVFATWFGDPGQPNSLQSGMALMDREGVAVWSSAGLAGYRVAAGVWTPTGVWTLQEAEFGTVGPNLLVFIGVDGSVGAVREVPEAHHDLALLDDGSLLWLETDIRSVEDAGAGAGEHLDVVGDALQRLWPDGALETVFSSWDALPFVPGESQTWDSGYYGDAKDWSHANGLDVNAAQDGVLVSFLGISVVIEVSLATGAVLWSLSVLALEDPATRSASFHSPVWSDTERLKLFINEPLEGDAASYVSEIDVSLDPPREVWNSGREDSSRYTQALGRVAQLDGDHTLVNYGTEAVIEEIDDLGSPLWRWSLEGQWVLGETEVITLWER